MEVAEHSLCQGWVYTHIWLMWENCPSTYLCEPVLSGKQRKSATEIKRQKQGKERSKENWGDRVGILSATEQFLLRY